MHSLSTAFLLGYHGCDRDVGEQLLLNRAFRPSENDFDWLGSGIYFWEANPDRAMHWATQRSSQKNRLDGKRRKPFVVGAVIDPGFCLDLLSANGIQAVEQAYRDLKDVGTELGVQLPENMGRGDYPKRRLDCAVINSMHSQRARSSQQPFDSVRGVFIEGDPIYKNSGFRHKTHIQICVRNPEMIKGVFRVPEKHFSIA
jgi:hypothetical protein